MYLRQELMISKYVYNYLKHNYEVSIHKSFVKSSLQLMRIQRLRLVFKLLVYRRSASTECKVSFTDFSPNVLSDFIFVSFRTFPVKKPFCFS